MKTSDFDYYLPQELIAQSPFEPRDKSRLMVVNRVDGSIGHGTFCDIAGYLRTGDILVLNNSRVIPARLIGKKVDSGGRVEILLLRRFGEGWEALVKPGSRIKIGTNIEINKHNSSLQRSGILAEIGGLKSDGVRLVRFSDESLLPGLGEVPLPPYIHAPLTDPERYQTVYADEAGSVAAPTAGLHFTPELLTLIQNKGVDCLFVTLHIGLDTFRPVKEENPIEHPVYREYAVLSDEAARKLSRAKEEGRRIICVGTTAVRLIEYVAQLDENPRPFKGWVDLFILPGYRFHLVDAMITNFHLPRSTTLMLATAFAGKNLIKKAYLEAVASGYRFYSFGDAMLIL